MYKIVFVVNNLDFLISHRIDVCRHLLEQGFEVHVICPANHTVSKFSDLGLIFHELDFGRDRLNPVSETKAVVRLVALFNDIQPDLVHLITIKPYIYGGIAARISKVPSVVSAVAGLGILFSSEELKYRFLRLLLFPLFKLAFGHKNQFVIFQNWSDSDALIKWGIIDQSKVKIIRGSGVDLKNFPFVAESARTPVISFAARLLIDKGVEVFVEASKILRHRNVVAEFWLIGEPDKGNRNSVSDAQLKQWHQAGLVELLGFREDIPSLFSQSNIVTLPSFYGEGLPKVLVEAAACGRVVITTDHPGCRDAIEPNSTGVLVPIKNAEALADAIQDLMDNPDKRRSMGKAGRALAEKEFSIQKIVMQHMDIYQELFKSRSHL